MGTFMAIGLAIRVSAEKSSLKKAAWDTIQLQDAMTAKLQYNPALYDMNEDDRFYHFVLKETVLQEQLIPFLETIYPFLYPHDVSEYNGVIQKLETLPFSEWITWSKSKYEPAFQFDNYGEDDYLSYGFNSIAVSYDSVLISMQGKVIMEEYSRHFSFFKSTMMQAFQQFSLAGALRVYLT